MARGCVGRRIYAYGHVTNIEYIGADTFSWHRLKLPAMVDFDGGLWWYEDNLSHRDNKKPSVIRSGGNVFEFRNRGKQNV